MFHKKPCKDEEQNNKYENCVANIFTVHSQNCNEGEYQSSHMVMQYISLEKNLNKNINY